MSDEKKPSAENAADTQKVCESKDNGLDTAKKPKKEKKAKQYKICVPLYRTFRILLKPIALTIWPTKIINRENYDGFGSGMLICNHYSTLDGVIPAAKMFKKELHAVIKTEAFEGSKIAEWFLITVGGIPVHRGEADITAVKAIMDVLRSDKQLLIFPEGTRNKRGDENMAEFKDGTARFAIKAKKPILPMIYFRAPKAFRKNWLYIGEPFELTQFYDARPTEENKRLATAYVREKMDEARVKCNEYVALHDKKYAKRLAAEKEAKDAENGAEKNVNTKADNNAVKDGGTDK